MDLIGSILEFCYDFWKDLDELPCWVKALVVIVTILLLPLTLLLGLGLLLTQET